MLYLRKKNPKVYLLKMKIIKKSEIIVIIQINIIILTVLIEKQVIKVDKDGNESIETISYKTKFIDSARFMVSSLSNLVDNLGERIHKIIYKDCDCFLEYKSIKENLIKYKCLSCIKGYVNKHDQELKKKFKNTIKFSDNGTNKLILLLKKVFILMNL